MHDQGNDVETKGRILIVGGGPAGSATAFWLARAGFRVTVAEQSTRQPYGQGIDIQDEAVEVVRRMGLLDQIKANTTGEVGFTLLDSSGEVIASVGSQSMERKDGPILSPTNEIEIMRGTLTKIFADAAKENGVEYRYGCTIASLAQTPTSVTATLSDTNVSEEFTAVIGADGIGSKIRKLAFHKTTNENCYVQTDTYIAFYSMRNPNPTSSPSAPPHNSKFQHATHGRAIWTRPIDRQGERVSTYLIVTSPNNRELQSAASSHCTAAQQKAVLERLFSPDSLSGLCPAAIAGMLDSEDFYFARLCQVRLPSWHTGRIALVGDAACAPSPLCGGGNTLAILGAYILAGELGKNPENPEEAFREYRARLAGYVEEHGQIPLWGYMPGVLTPQTRVGVWLLQTGFWIASGGLVQRFFRALLALGSLGGREQKTEKEESVYLPRYGFEVA